MNRDASKIGVPYARVSQINIYYPDSTGGHPRATVFQALAVTLADGTVRELSPMASIEIEIDLASNGQSPVPLVHPVTGAELGAHTNLQQVFGGVLAVVRQAQLAEEATTAGAAL